jgi:hypothetical protein
VVFFATFFEANNLLKVCFGKATKGSTQNEWMGVMGLIKGGGSFNKPQLFSVFDLKNFRHLI